MSKTSDKYLEANENKPDWVALPQLGSSGKAFWRDDIYPNDKNDEYVLGATVLTNRVGLLLYAPALTNFHAMLQFIYSVNT